MGVILGRGHRGGGGAMGEGAGPGRLGGSEGGVGGTSGEGVGPWGEWVECTG